MEVKNDLPQMKRLFLVTSAVLFALFVGESDALNNGLGITPPMAWNSWYHYFCQVNETVVRATIDAVVSTGLTSKGYAYINLDDCWAGFRNPNGTIHSDPTAFPSGIKSLADYAHAKNLGFGVYTDLGYKTCAGRPGSLGFEAIDALTYASWGVDFVKVDNCNTDGSTPETRYPVMSLALNESGRAQFFSLCEWGVDDPAKWAPAFGNSWRTTGDLTPDQWDVMMNRADLNEPLYPYAGPGGWNDPDMLQVGNTGMSSVEYQTQFSLWAIMKAPMIISLNVANMSAETWNIVGNEEVIAVNQDPLGVQGHRVWSDAAGPVPYTASSDAILEPCDSKNLFQQWRFNSSTGIIAEEKDGRGLEIGYCRNFSTHGNHVAVFPYVPNGCANATNQFWQAVTSSTGGSGWVQLVSQMNNQCLTARPFRSTVVERGTPKYFLETLPCKANDSAQLWQQKDNQRSQSADFPSPWGSRVNSALCLSVIVPIPKGVTEVWAGPLQDNAIAVVLLNRGTATSNITAHWDDVGASSPTTSYWVRDLVAKKNLGIFSSSFTAAVDSHGTKTLKLTPV